MRAASLLFGGLMLAAAAVPSRAAAPYPTTAVLDALRAACTDKQRTTAAIDGAAIPGWTKVDPAKTPVGPLLAFGREQGAKMMGSGGRILGPSNVHRAVVAGETLYLIPSGVVVDGTIVRGCRLYDPGETRPLDSAAIARWMGAPPRARAERAELTKLSWSPGYGGADSFEAFLVPAGSPLLALVKLDGLAVKADWVEHSKTESVAPARQEEKK